MAKSGSQAKYAGILNGSEIVESSMHSQLIEHVNAEIVLGTIRDLSDGISWIQSTFMFVRLAKNPTKFKTLFKAAIGDDFDVDKSVKALFVDSLQQLTDAKMVEQHEDGLYFQASELGTIMSKYCITFETMKYLLSLPDETSMPVLLHDLCKSTEITSDIIVRTNEKSILNGLNVMPKNKKEKEKSNQLSSYILVYYFLLFWLKFLQSTTFILIQACLGGLTLNDFALNQETMRIMRIATRLISALYEALLSLCDDGGGYCKNTWKSVGHCGKSGKLLYNTCLLSKSIKLRMWFDSDHVLKQFPGIGQMISNSFVMAGVKHLETLAALDPLRIEMIASRHPPFGNTLLAQVKSLPRIGISLTLEENKILSIKVSLINLSCVNQANRNHALLIIVTNENDHMIFVKSLRISNILPAGSLTFNSSSECCEEGTLITAKLINLNVVGFDASSSINLPISDRYEPIQADKANENVQQQQQQQKSARKRATNKRETGKDNKEKRKRGGASFSTKIDEYLQKASKKKNGKESFSYYFDHSLIWNEDDCHEKKTSQEARNLDVIGQSLTELFNGESEKNLLQCEKSVIPDCDQILNEKFELDDEDLLKCAVLFDDTSINKHSPEPYAAHCSQSNKVHDSTSNLAQTKNSTIKPAILTEQPFFTILNDKKQNIENIEYDKNSVPAISIAGTHANFDNKKNGLSNTLKDSVISVNQEDEYVANTETIADYNRSAPQSIKPDQRCEVNANETDAQSFMSEMDNDDILLMAIDPKSFNSNHDNIEFSCDGNGGRQHTHISQQEPSYQSNIISDHDRLKINEGCAKSAHRRLLEHSFLNNLPEKSEDRKWQHQKSNKNNAYQLTSCLINHLTKTTDTKQQNIICSSQTNQLSAPFFNRANDQYTNLQNMFDSNADQHNRRPLHKSIDANNSSSDRCPHKNRYELVHADNEAACMTSKMVESLKKSSVAKTIGSGKVDSAEFSNMFLSLYGSGFKL